MKRVLTALLCLVGAIQGHLLPQALEDVHAFVQTELQQRSHGQFNIESPPSGGPMFQAATQTQTYIGVPVLIQKEVRFDGNGGLQKPLNFLNTAQSQSVVQQQQQQNGGDLLPRGLLPPSPMQQQQQQQQQAASNEHAQIIPANLVGPSTFINNGNVQVPQEIITQGNAAAAQSAVDGWVPLDREGSSKLAKGVGVNLQVGGGDQTSEKAESGSDLAYKGTGYSVKSEASKNENNNELEILPTNSIKFQDIVIGTKNSKLTRSPVYPGGARSPKIVIHAQNVIVRGTGGEDSSETEITSLANNNATVNNVKQFPAYGAVPQLNNYLRDQLRLAALNQLMNPRHPLSEKPFPRPLSLREIARAVRNGQFPTEPIPDPLLSQPSQLQFSLPHVVKMNPDALPLPSIQSQSKLPLPGGLGSLYKNMLQQDGVGGAGFDPREPLEYSLLAALSGQKLKAPSHVPTFKSKPHSQYIHDYGDSVAYTTAGKEEGRSKDPIQIVPAQPTLDDILRPQLQLPHQLPLSLPLPLQQQQNPGSLRGVSEQLLKQMILQELGEIQDTPNVLLPQGLSNPARLPLRHLRPSVPKPAPYGINAHPFAHLAGGQPDAVFEETYEYTLPPGANIEEFMNSDVSVYGKGPKGYPPPSHGHGHSDEDDTAVPLNKDTLIQFGKGLFNSALEFSRHHNPLTLLSKIKSLPPVKVDLYKVPMGVPDELVEKYSEKWSSGGGSSSRGGGRHRDGSRRGGRGGAGGRGGQRGRRKHSPRKNSSKY